jgi:hypothetical protein
MSHNWNIPSTQEYDRGEPPTIWVPVVAFVAIIIAGIFITLVNWTPGKTILVAPFFGWAIVVPILIWAVLCAFWYLPHDDWIDKTDRYNYLVKNRYASWRVWTQANLPIVTSSVLTPEVDLAERMLALEGEPPANAGAALSLADGHPGDATRIEQILDKLLAPMLAHLRRLDGTEAVHIVLQSSNPAQLETLHQTLKRMELRWVHSGNLKHIKGAGEEAALIEEWIDLRGKYDYYGRYTRGFEAALVVALQLHEADIEPTSTEAAVALLFTSHAVVKKYTFKPQAGLFRPAQTELPDLPQRLEALYTAAPAPLDKLKHAWISGLSKLARNNLNGALRDGERELDVHSLDEALGLPGPANTWLMQALAAQMVTYGQGPQLVVAPTQAGVALNLLGKNLSPVERAAEPEINFYPASTSVAFSCLGGLILILIEKGAFGDGWFFTVAIFFFLLVLVGQPLRAMLKRRTVDEEFWLHS